MATTTLRPDTELACDADADDIPAEPDMGSFAPPQAFYLYADARFQAESTTSYSGAPVTKVRVFAGGQEVAELRFSTAGLEHFIAAVQASYDAKAAS